MDPWAGPVGVRGVRGMGASRGGPRKSSGIRLGWSLGEPRTAQRVRVGPGSKESWNSGAWESWGRCLEKRRDAAPKKPEG